MWLLRLRLPVCFHLLFDAVVVIGVVGCGNRCCLVLCGVGCSRCWLRVVACGCLLLLGVIVVSADAACVAVGCWLLLFVVACGVSPVAFVGVVSCCVLLVVVVV